jgi:hypothetical protein
VRNSAIPKLRTGFIELLLALAMLIPSHRRVYERLVRLVPGELALLLN